MADVPRPDSPQAAPPPAATPSPATRPYSRGGLIGVGIMTAWCAVGVAASYHSMPGYMIFSYVAANAALFWRAFRPPLSFGQGFVTWLGGMIAGLAVSALGAGPWYIQLVLFLLFIAFGGVFLWAGRPKKPKPKTQA
jgi:hypothetical protein